MQLWRLMLYALLLLPGFIQVTLPLGQPIRSAFANNWTARTIILGNSLQHDCLFGCVLHLEYLPDAQSICWSVSSKALLDF